MNFLYPQFLYGLLALAIPVIIHLFNFRKTKRVYFSNTRFLQKVKDASSAKQKLKHYLILLSRLLLLFFLVIAFAQPYLPAEQESNTDEKVLIYLDNSMSMSNQVEEDMEAFEAAVDYINELVTLYPASTQYKVLTNDYDAYSNAYRSKRDIGDLTTEIKISGVTRTFDDIKSRLTLNEEDKGNHELFWLSDFQASTAGSKEVVFDSTYHVNLVPLKFNNVNNVYVDSLYLDNPFLIGDEKLKLSVVLRNIGEEEVRDLIVKVFVDDIQSATSSVNITANGMTTTTFDLAFNLDGNNKCRISFEDFPVTFDNDFYFTIDGSREIDILEIKSASSITSIGKVFGNEDLFNLESMNVSNLDYNLIPEADLVVINGLQTIDASLVTALNASLKGYGHILLIPSALPDVNSYRQLTGLGNLAATDSTLKTDLASPDFNDPFFSNVFEERNQNFMMPEAAGVISWGRDRTALLKFRNGLPFLSRITTQGDVFLMASPLELQYSNFQTHAIFVPVMYRLAVESASAGPGLYYFIDNPAITLKVDTFNTDNVFKLQRGEEELLPAQHISGSNVYLEASKFTLEAGFYDLMFEGDRVTSLAFNNSPAESDLRQLTVEGIQNAFKGKIALLDVENKEQFAKEIEKKYIGEPLWKYAIALVLLFLLFEILLIRFLP